MQLQAIQLHAIQLQVQAIQLQAIGAGFLNVSFHATSNADSHLPILRLQSIDCVRRQNPVCKCHAGEGTVAAVCFKGGGEVVLGEDEVECGEPRGGQRQWIDSTLPCVPHVFMNVLGYISRLSSYRDLGCLEEGLCGALLLGLAAGSGGLGGWCDGRGGDGFRRRAKGFRSVGRLGDLGRLGDFGRLY